MRKDEGIVEQWRISRGEVVKYEVSLVYEAAQGVLGKEIRR